MNAIPGATIEAVTAKFATGLAGTVGVRIRDNAGNDAAARVTAGIVEDIASSGIYRKSLTAPTTSGQYTIVWDNGSGVFDIEELVIAYSASGAAVADHAYVAFADFKSSLSMDSQTFADNDIVRAINSGSRGVDHLTGRRFWLDTDNTSVRYYTPDGARLLMIDDVVDVAAVDIDRGGSGSFSEAWTENTDYVLEPFNAAADGWPQSEIRPRRLSGRWFPCGVERSVRVTGQFGWSAVPEDIATAATILAHKLIRRVREAPFGVLVVGGIDTTTAIRIGRYDPDITGLVSDYVRHTPFL